jgi:3-deoxy-D-manno-octulosonic-acid transferase
MQVTAEGRAPAFDRAVWVRRVYSLALYLAVPWLVGRLLWRGLSSGRGAMGLRERFGYVAESAPDSRPLWLHAVSVGEINAAVPLIQLIRAAEPGLPLLVTTTTPSGREAAAGRLGHGVTIAFFPFDLPGAVRRFVARVRPRLLVLIETELWPNLIAECGRRKVPILLANARLSAKSARGYRVAGSLTRHMLTSIALIAAQARDDASRFLALGAVPEAVRVTGNLKFDVRVVPSLAEESQALRRRLGPERAVWVAGSTREGEEAIVLDAFARVRGHFEDALLVLAPRHPERCDAVADLCRARRYAVRRHSAAGAGTGSEDVYLLDTLGELARFYAAADVAFVGGSLVKHGGQNLLEPASCGKPIVAGPHTYNFASVAALLADAGALTVVHDADELAAVVSALLGDGNRRFEMGEAARAVFRSNRGASTEVLMLVRQLLGRRP